MKRNEKYSRPGKLWSKTFPYNNSIVSLFFYRGLFETSDHDITVETSIEQINVGRRNNFHLVIISNGEASRIERVFIEENFYPRIRQTRNPTFQYTTFLRSMEMTSFREYLTTFVPLRQRSPPFPSISKEDRSLELVTRCHHLWNPLF